ncbi:MAG: hypothetical protein V8S58_12205 [Lachnospiraceae bacterium]
MSRNMASPMLFTFRKYSEIQKESVQFTNGSYITFDFLEDICDMELLKTGQNLCKGEPQYHSGEYR